jgi:hypothetical protein
MAASFSLDHRARAHPWMEPRNKMADKHTGSFRFIACLAAMACALVGPPAWGQSASGQSTSAQAGVPRGLDGKPDFSGFWQSFTTANWDIQNHSPRKGVPGGQGIVEGNELPYQPWALAKKKENYANRAEADPDTKCYLPGLPRLTYEPFPFEIVQRPEEITVLYEYIHTVRSIYTNNSKHPPDHIDWYLGDSRGHWEGDTLVVDLIHFNDQTWFDHAGNFHSDALHLVERYSYLDPDHLNYEVTVEDPKVFTRPWKLNLVLYRHKETNFQLLDYECYGFDYENIYP